MVDYELNELRREFLGEAKEKVDEMHAMVARLIDDDESQTRLAYLAHQLKGSGGSYGYQSISDDAAEIEKVAEALPTADGQATEFAEKIRMHIVNLQSEIEKASSELE